MAPHKGQAKPGKASSGHVKKPSTVVTQGRTIVQPAIPLPMISKQHTKSSAKHNSTTSTVSTPSSTNGFPASSLEAALAGHGDNITVPVPVTVPVQDCAKALHQSAKATGGSNVEKPENATNVSNTSNAPNGTSNGCNDKSSYDAAPVNGVNGTRTTIRQPSIPPVAPVVTSLGSGSGFGSGTGTGTGSDSGSAPASVSASVNDTCEGNPHLWFQLSLPLLGYRLTFDRLARCCSTYLTAPTSAPAEPLLAHSTIGPTTCSLPSPSIIDPPSTISDLDR